MWSSYRDLLLRDEACVVAGQQQGGEGGHGEGPPLVRHGGLLADLEPHRRGQGECAADYLTFARLGDNCWGDKCWGDK